jgi:hypothetical protein
MELVSGRIDLWWSGEEPNRAAGLLCVLYLAGSDIYFRTRSNQRLGGAAPLSSIRRNS